ncbi:MAG: tetratricopeptide repeat protein [Bacteroidota bacterium]|nr:tetratricopeptide repeat protein [Bacteroidota bacterium]
MKALKIILLILITNKLFCQDLSNSCGLIIDFKEPLDKDWKKVGDNGKYTTSYKAIMFEKNKTTVYRITYTELNSNYSFSSKEYKIFKQTYLDNILKISNESGMSVKKTVLKDQNAIETFDKMLYDGIVYDAISLYFILGNNSITIQVMSDKDVRGKYQTFLSSIRFAEKYVNNKRKNIDELISLGQQGINEQDPNRAIKYYKQALQIEPKNERASAGIALAFMALGEWQKAIEYSTLAISINSKQAVAYFIRGCAKGNLGQDGCTDLSKSKSLGYEMANKGLLKYCNKL